MDVLHWSLDPEGLRKKRLIRPFGQSGMQAHCSISSQCADFVPLMDNPEALVPTSTNEPTFYTAVEQSNMLQLSWNLFLPKRWQKHWVQYSRRRVKTLSKICEQMSETARTEDKLETKQRPP